MGRSEGAELMMTLVGHLTELRRCILKALAGWLVGAVIFGFFTDQVFDYLTKPFGVTGLVYIAPAEGFLSYLKLTVFGGLVLASPLVLYQAFRFLLPGLHRKEKRILFRLIPGAALCMLLGIGFGYFVILPLTIRYLLGFGTASLTPMLSVQKYIGFVTTTLLLMGGVFELPLVLVGLTRFGVVTPHFLRSHRKYAILLATVVGAVLTPPDVLSQIILAGPLILLYEVSIWLSYGLGKKREEQKESLLKDV